MDCYLKEWTDWYTKEVFYKGFPVVKESQRATAEDWSRSKRPIEIPEVLENVEIIGYDDRMNNKVFTLAYHTTLMGKPIKVTFDMYADPLLDLIKHGSIEKGVIKVPITVGERGKFVAVDGEIYQSYLEKIEEQKQIKAAKTIKRSDLKVGTIYQNTPSGETYLYLGRYEKGFLCTTAYGRWSHELDTWCSVEFRSSVSWKFEGPTLDKDKILEYLNDRAKTPNSRNSYYSNEDPQWVQAAIKNVEETKEVDK